MTRKICDICYGTRRIRLPIKPTTPIAIYPDGEVKDDMIRETSREYPCPECSPHVDDNHVQMIGMITQAPLREWKHDAPRIKRHVHENIAHKIAVGLLDAGFIHFTERKWDMHPECGPDTMEVTGRMGVVTTNVVSSMDDRIKTAGTKIAMGIHETARREFFKHTFFDVRGPIHPERAFELFSDTYKGYLETAARAVKEESAHE